MRRQPVSSGCSGIKQDLILLGIAAGVVRVPESGGTPVVILKVNPEKNETGYRYPHLLPDGRTLLYPPGWDG